jgi:hypothetical protein
VRRLVLALALVAACATAKRLASNVTTAKVTCERCQAGLTVGVGATFNLRVDWDRCSDVDPDCDPNKPPFFIAATCEGLACKIDDTGSGDFEVTPTAAGTGTVVVHLKDTLERVERLGPFTAAVATAIDIRCTYIPAGGGLDAVTPCDAGIPAHSDVYLEAIAKAGDRSLAAPMVNLVAVDGRPVYADGQMVGDTPWTCAPSTITTDRTVPSVTRCHHADAAPGATWTVDAGVKALQLGARATITVARK